VRQKWQDLKGLFDSFFTPRLLNILVTRSNEYARQVGHRVGRKFKLCRKDPTRTVEQGGCGHGQHRTRHAKSWKRMLIQRDAWRHEDLTHFVCDVLVSWFLYFSSFLPAFTVGSFTTFFGVLIYIELWGSKHGAYTAWDTDNSLDFVCAAMTRHSFEEHLQMMSFVGDLLPAPANPLFKLQPLIDELSEAFAANYDMGPDSALDESMIAHTGLEGTKRCGWARQFIAITPPPLSS